MGDDCDSQNMERDAKQFADWGVDYVKVLPIIQSNHNHCIFHQSYHNYEHHRPPYYRNCNQLLVGRVLLWAKQHGDWISSVWCLPQQVRCHHYCDHGVIIISIVMIISIVTQAILSLVPTSTSGMSGPSSSSCSCSFSYSYSFQFGALPQQVIPSLSSSSHQSLIETNIKGPGAPWFTPVPGLLTK